MYVIHQTTAYVLARSGFMMASIKTYTMPTHTCSQLIRTKSVRQTNSGGVHELTEYNLKYSIPPCISQRRCAHASPDVLIRLASTICSMKALLYAHVPG